MVLRRETSSVVFHNGYGGSLQWPRMHYRLASKRPADCQLPRLAAGSAMSKKKSANASDLGAALTNIEIFICSDF